MTLPVGLLLYSEYPTRELIETAKLTERLGYNQLWYTDVRFQRDCFVGLAAIAANTERIFLGPGVTDPYSRHPAQTAAAIASLDELSGGRALVGLGVGGSGFNQIGLEAPLPVAAMREAVDAIRRLLAGEEVTIEGKVITVRNGRLDFKTIQDRIPIYFATHGAQVTRLAGQIADGVLFANMLVPDAVAHYLGLLMEGMQAAGRDPDSMTVALRFEVAMADDHAAAVEVMRRRVATRLVGQYPKWDYLEHLGVTIPTEFREVAERKDKRLVKEAMAALPDEVLQRTVLVGQPQEIASQIQRVLRPEVKQIIIRPHAIPGQSVDVVIQKFVETVMPLVESGSNRVLA